MVNARQIPMNLLHPVSFDLSDFIVSASNDGAFRFLMAFAGSDIHFGALVGPAGCGKSHLLHGWGKEQGAISIGPADDLSKLIAGQLYIVDDINQRNKNGEFSFSDDYLFHLYNWTREINATVVVTADSAPSRWERTLPDLVSRLATIQVTTIEQPDDELLLVLLVKLFSDRQLQVNIDVLNYIVSRMERSFSAARLFVDLVDKTALAEKKKITKTLVRGCLEAL